ncbi:MAG TPA: HEAT repeat domain-containing protein [Phycisphaerae bacterium]|nr:HEAT repeat domain-containing protein [Phycisphaerae bacterium]
MLADALPEVRLLGVKLAMKLIDTGQTLPDQTVSRLMAMMYDSSAQVRQAAATVLADLNHPGSAKTLLNCLKTETYPEVRVAILEELGQLKKPLTLPAIIQSIASEDDQESAAAAQALTQLAQAHLIAQPAEISQATSALIARYESLLNNENSYALREALLTAMGSLAAPAAKTVLQNAVNSKSGAIRLAAIAGLEQYKDRSLAPIFAEKIHDSDRGVRLAAVKALTGANDRKYLETLIMMASPKVESDLAIRQAAAQAALEICRNADAGTLVTTLKLLRQQQQIDSSLKIELLQLYLKSLTNQETPRKLMVELDLADELVLNSQPNDAAVLLSQAVRLAKKLAQTSPVSPAEIWEKYIQLLIDTGAPETIKEIADQNDPKQRKVAIEHILSWIRSPAADKNLTATITVTDGTLTKLGEDLTDGQKKALRGKMLAAVKTQQVIDRQQVARLLTDYMGTDGVKSADALKQIKAMGDRALKPLLESLKNVIGGEKANPDQEKSIIMLIKQVAPQVGDYDPNEPAAQKITRINDWLKKL